MMEGLRALYSTPSRKVVLALILGQIIIILVVLESNIRGRGSVMKQLGTAVHLTRNWTMKDDNDSIPVDLHTEDPLLGHTWETNEAHDLPLNQSQLQGIDMTTIAIGMGLTSRGVKSLTVDNLHKTMAFFTTLLPTFCKTCSKGFKYHFFIAYDYNDAFFTKSTFLQSYTSKFLSFTGNSCPHESEYRIHYVKCSHSKSPAWAQNDAMMEAYMSNMAYFYRINDDTAMKTPGWSEIFIKTLAKQEPKDGGVVGPTHRGGNMAILTYDFVSYHHVEIFGYYYPRLFPDWHADRWITEVYKPGRTQKLPEVRLDHTMKLGQRYKHHKIAKESIKGQIAADQKTLLRYLKAQKDIESGKTLTKDSKNPNVISLSVYGKDPIVTYGAIRNALLLNVYYPEWTIRVYVSNTKANLKVPPLVLNKLYLNKVNIVEVPDEISELPPEMWRYLVIDDPDVERFLIRDAQGRFNEREAIAVTKWLQKSQEKGFHCIRDHTDHKSHAIVDGLWGGTTSDLIKNLNGSMKSLLLESKQINSPQDSSTQSQKFLEDILWPRVKESAMCHDSVSCDQWAGSVPFPVLRHVQNYVGGHFDPYGQNLNKKPTSLPGAKPDGCNIST